MNIVLVPHISEKAIDSAEKGVYVFEVPTSANKIEVAKIVASRFKVEVKDVNMLIHKGKLKRFQRKLGRQNDTKKAIVKLKKGQSIALFEGGK
ncbi:MAG TPA: 50S ribosomal protein L23 [Candidatus Nanoarchaeia archaeon]|nr:50S ribosomal protein L23 [Candidatus Nanoarchaeia archaeon]